MQYRQLADCRQKYEKAGPRKELVRLGCLGGKPVFIEKRPKSQTLPLSATPPCTPTKRQARNKLPPQPWNCNLWQPALQQLALRDEQDHFRHARQLAVEQQAVLSAWTSVATRIHSAKFATWRSSSAVGGTTFRKPTSVCLCIGEVW